MTNKIMKPCRHVGCKNVVKNGYCEEHRTKKNDTRPNSNSRGYNTHWRKFRLVFLSANPLCTNCLKMDRHTPATVVDHIRDHKGNYDLFWDIDNMQALCKRCHDSKTAKTINKGRGMSNLYKKNNKDREAGSA